MADLDVPKVGKVDKKIVVPIVVAAGAFVGYRYWKARQNVGTGDPVDPGYEDMSGGLGPGVVRPNNDYGLPADTTTTPKGGFRGTTNSEWTEYVTDRLQQDGRWSYSVIAVALGNFLSNKPLSTEQQQIAQAAIGIAGDPPSGTHVIIPGGNTTITIAPTGVSGSTKSPERVTISFAGVAGAATYNVYVNGSVRGTGTGSPIDLTGLTPGTSYSVAVAAVAASGAVGPKSSAIIVKTQGAAVGKPAQPTITVNTGGGRVTFKTTSLPYATRYDWFLNGKLVNTTNTPAVTFTSLKPKARYSPGVTVRAAAATGAPGPVSTAKSFTTK